jgi:hypothetical protein
VRIVKPTDFGRRAGAMIAGVTGDSAVDDAMELPLLRGERLAGRVLTRFVVSTALLTSLTAVAGAALAWLGIWEPLVAFVVLVLLAALSWRVSTVVPTRALPVWTAMALLVISLGATTWAGLTHDEQVLPRSESGVNAQAAVSLARQHKWPISLPANEFGGPEVLRIPGVTIGSPGFQQVGSSAQPVIEPQALVGVPVWLSIGVWFGGVAGMMWVPALFSGLVVLAIGLLTSSVVGPRWGPLGAFATAMCFPLLHAARATSADVVVLFVLCSGVLLLVAATRAGARGHWQQARAVGFVAGALVASGSFFRPDAVGQSVALLPLATLLVIRRDGAGAPVLWGASVSTALFAMTGLGLSRGLLQEQRSSLIPLGLLAVGLALLASATVLSARRGVSVPDGARAVLPALVAALAMIGGLALLAVPPSRQAVVWTSWWTGPFALAITLVVVAVAAHRLTRAWLRGEPLPAWTGALMVGLGAAILHWRSTSGADTAPWVSGGLVVALPLVIVSVATAAAWITRRSTRRLPTVAAVVISVGTAAMLLVPEAAASLPHARDRVSRGEVAAVQQVCREFGPEDVVLMVDERAADEWLPTVRATCEVPALSLTTMTRRDPIRRASAVAAVAQAVDARGGRLVLVAADSVAALESSASAPARIGVPIAALHQRLTQDPVQVTGRPDGLSSVLVQVWVARVG